MTRKGAGMKQAGDGEVGDGSDALEPLVRFVVEARLPDGTSVDVLRSVAVEAMRAVAGRMDVVSAAVVTLPDGTEDEVYRSR